MIMKNETFINDKKTEQKNRFNLIKTRKITFYDDAWDLAKYSIWSNMILWFLTQRYQQR